MTVIEDRTMSYEQQLQTPQWLAKREEIMRRDWYMCTKCMSTKNLQVHHKKYQPGKMAWEYEGWFALDLVTLCRKCHCEEHGIPYEARNYQYTCSSKPMWWDEYRIRDGRQHESSRGPRHISEIIMEWING